MRTFMVWPCTVSSELPTKDYCATSPLRAAEYYAEAVDVFGEVEVFVREVTFGSQTHRFQIDRRERYAMTTHIRTVLA